jgi:hypothetical protein
MQSESDLKTSDVAYAAGLLMEAVREAPSRDLTSISTPYGEATVILDGQAADVEIPGKEATVHVRFDPAATARA